MRGTDFKEGDVVLKSAFKEANEIAEAACKDTAKSKKTKPARGKTLLLGITKASLQSESLISAGELCSEEKQGRCAADSRGVFRFGCNRQGGAESPRRIPLTNLVGSKRGNTDHWAT